MSNNNELFGGSDLFSYFGGNFSVSSNPEPRPQQDPIVSNGTTPAGATQNALSDSTSAAATDKDGTTNVVALEGKRKVTPRRRNNPDDACPPGEGNKANVDDDLTDEDRDALSEEEEEDKEVADRAELGRQVVKSDDKSAAAKAETKPVFNNATYICYAGINRPITKYFTVEKLALVGLEDVRKRLEKDHPELSKQRTKMEWDAKKNLIVPIVTGGKKGAWFFEESRAFFSSAKELFKNKEFHPINIFAAQDGFYEVRENPIGVFVAKTSPQDLQNWSVFEEFSAKLPSTLESCREGFKLKLPKIPDHLFLQLVSFFMDYVVEDVEVMGIFYWNTEEKRYVLDVPLQHVSKVSVDPCYTGFPPHFIKVAEVHSHNTMRANFSPIDDADELGTMLYGVIGRLKKAMGTIRFDIRTRAGVAGKFIPLLPSVWINCDYDNQDDSWNLAAYTPYPEKWKNRVTIMNPKEVIDHA
ncbi:hypothetical protein P4K96_04210 [Bacillus cereus]|nr:hypothetical protein [Bacillus cereus]